jgi:hypothetical protein
MIPKIKMFGFKQGVGYQMSKREERLFDRYLLAAEKSQKNAKRNPNDISKIKCRKK